MSDELRALYYGEVDLGLADLLDWVADRLVQVHGDEPNVDFVLALRRHAKEQREGAPHWTRSVQSIAESLEKIANPLARSEMMASDVSQRVEEYIRNALPFFEPEARPSISLTKLSDELEKAARVADDCARQLDGVDPLGAGAAEYIAEGIRALKSQSPAWTFLHEWHVQADRVVIGGLRESGPT